MRSRLFVPAVLLALTLQAGIARCQQLTVQTESGKQAVFGRSDIEALPRVKVRTAGSSAPVTFEGVLLRAVLEKAGVQLGETLKGKRMASYLLVGAADGYRVVIALPEIDQGFTD